MTQSSKNYPSLKFLNPQTSNFRPLAGGLFPANFPSLSSVPLPLPQAFTVESVLNVLGSVLADLCQKDWDHRDDDDIIIIERILLLVRNVLHVSPDPQEEKVQEKFIQLTYIYTYIATSTIALPGSYSYGVEH